MQVSGLLTLPGSFTCGQRTFVPTEQEAGWATVSVWKFWKGGKRYSCPCWEFNPGLSTPQCGQYTDCASLAFTCGVQEKPQTASQDGQYPNKNLDRASPEHKPEALPLHPIYSAHLRQHTKCHKAGGTN
jgi:hypothetical protein